MKYRHVEVKEVANGFSVTLDQEHHYVFMAPDVLKMLAFVGKYFYGQKVRVVED